MQQAHIIQQTVHAAPPRTFVAGAIALILYFLASSIGYAQGDQPVLAGKSLKELFRAGLSGGINLNFHSADFKSLPGVPSCCPRYESGNGNGIAIGGTFLLPLVDQWSFGLRAGYGEYGGTLTTDESELIDANGESVMATFRHTINASIGSISIEPTIQYRILDRMRVMAGGQLGVVVNANYDQQELLAQPLTVLFENGTRTRLVSSGTIPEASSIQAAALLGASYEIPLNNRGDLLGVPEIAFGVGLTPVVAGETWSIATLRLGIGVEYISLKTYELPPPPPAKPMVPPAAPLPEPVKEPVLTASLHALYLDIEGNDHPIEKIHLEKIRSRSMAALLTYIFFDENSATLPDRYSLITEANAEEFNIANIKDDGLGLYYNILNIIGDRLRNAPSTSIIVTGCNTDVDSEEGNLNLSRSRAETVSKYLQDVWKINPNRIKIKTRNLPDMASRKTSEDGKAENRRVEITSDSWSIIEPIFYEDTLFNPNVDNITFRQTAVAEADIASWELNVTQNGKTVYKRAGAAPLPDTTNWTLKHWNRTVDLEEGEVLYSLSIQDKAGQRYVTPPQQLPVEVSDTLLNRRLDNYHLIIFPFNTSEMTPAHKRIAQMIKERMEGTSTVQIQGYADRIGEEGYNRQLSEERAKSLAKELNVADESAVGLGSTQLLYPNDLPEGRFYCRTVNVRIETTLDTTSDK